MTSDRRRLGHSKLRCKIDQHRRYETEARGGWDSSRVTIRLIRLIRLLRGFRVGGTERAGKSYHSCHSYSYGRALKHTVLERRGKILSPSHEAEVSFSSAQGTPESTLGGVCRGYQLFSASRLRPVRLWASRGVFLPCIYSFFLMIMRLCSPSAVPKDPIRRERGSVRCSHLAYFTSRGRTVSSLAALAIFL